MTTWADEYVTLLEDCEKRSERLSDWELGFVALRACVGNCLG